MKQRFTLKPTPKEAFMKNQSGVEALSAKLILSVVFFFLLSLQKKQNKKKPCNSNRINHITASKCGLQ
jgi:hypothetical protein